MTRTALSVRRPAGALAIAASAAIAVAAAFAGPSAADPPPTTPGGPWSDGDDDQISAIHSYEELWKALENIEGRAHGGYDLSPAPLPSNTGREIPVVTVGDGPTSIMYVANQHGDEYVVSEAMLSVVRAISGGSRQAQQIREQLTVTVVPRVNVDGFDADVTDAQGNTTPWRQNYDPSCAAYCGFYAQGRGYDPNRYHSYTANAHDHPYEPGDDENNPVPESVAMRLLWEERQPALVVDYHHQGTYVDDEGRMITGSVMWPNATDEAARLGIEDQFAATVVDSQRAVSEMVTALDQYGYANITRYPGTTTPGIARNAYGLLGSASVLYEARGGIDQKSRGSIVKQTEVAAMAMLDAAADGSLWTRSTAPAEKLPERGPSVPNPHE